MMSISPVDFVLATTSVSRRGWCPSPGKGMEFLEQITLRIMCWVNIIALKSGWETFPLSLFPCWHFCLYQHIFSFPLTRTRDTSPVANQLSLQQAEGQVLLRIKNYPTFQRRDDLVILKNRCLGPLMEIISYASPGRFRDWRVQCFCIHLD